MPNNSNSTQQEGGESQEQTTVAGGNPSEPESLKEKKTEGASCKKRNKQLLGLTQAVNKTSEVLLEGGLKPFPVSPYPDPLGVGLLADR